MKIEEIAEYMRKNIEKNCTVEGTAKENKAIVLPTDNEYTLKFRKPVSSDFPVLINIPKLVKEVTEINTDSILSVSDNE